MSNMENAIDLLKSNLSGIRIPDQRTHISNHCCASPKADGGLYIDMTSFIAFGKDYVQSNYNKTGNAVYLHIKQTKKEVAEIRPLKKPKVSSIGVEGSCGSELSCEPDYEESLNIVILPNYAILPFPLANLPEQVRLAIDGILLARAAERKEQVNIEMTTAEREGQDVYFDRSRILETAEAHRPIFGPGYTGLVNVGNSCYIAATMQAVFATRAFISRYYENQSLKSAFDAAPADPRKDLNMQLTKLGHGLLSGIYSFPSSEEGIPPLMFKEAVANNHPEFSTMSQQDALDFLLYLLQQVQRVNSGNPKMDPSRSFQFGVEERIQCLSGKVSYNRRSDYFLALDIPLQAATNKNQLEAFQKLKSQAESEEKDVAACEVVRPIIPLKACLDSYLAPEEVMDYFSTALKAKTTVKKTIGLTSFPDYLVLQMKRFVVEGGWRSKKLDVYIDVPDIIDIGHMRSNGLQPGEELLPESDNNDLISLTSQNAPMTTGINIENASDWISSNPNASSTSNMDSSSSGTVDTDTELPDGSSRYRLLGFVSHIGTSTDSGHYVAHFCKDGKWVLYDDKEVRASVHPPKDMGYLYFFERLADG